MRPAQLTPENGPCGRPGGTRDGASMRPAQLTPENGAEEARRSRGRGGASMRPAQLTPENFPPCAPMSGWTASFNEAGAINAGKLRAFGEQIRNP